MYAKENNYDKIFQKANAETGLQIAIFKAIAAAESQFEHGFKTYQDPRKYGLMGITEYAIANLRKINQETFGDVSPSDLMDPEINIRIAAKLLRWLYYILPNPALMDVFSEWGKLNASEWDFPSKAWNAYWHYSQKAGEPASIMPAEVEGVDLRKPEQKEYFG